MNLPQMVRVQMVMSSGRVRQRPMITETVSGKVTGLLYLLHGGHSHWEKKGGGCINVFFQ